MKSGSAGKLRSLQLVRVLSASHNCQSAGLTRITLRAACVNDSSNAQGSGKLHVIASIWPQLAVNKAEAVALASNDHLACRELHLTSHHDRYGAAISRWRHHRRLCSANPVRSGPFASRLDALCARSQRQVSPPPAISNDSILSRGMCVSCDQNHVLCDVVGSTST